MGAEGKEGEREREREEDTQMGKERENERDGRKKETDRLSQEVGSGDGMTINCMLESTHHLL